MKDNNKLRIAFFAFLTFCFYLNTNTSAQSQADFGWDSLSKGMNDTGGCVYALAVQDTTSTSPLYAGGRFFMAGRKSASNIAKWRDTTWYNGGGTWTPLGAGVNNTARALCMFKNYVYVGGMFDSAGGIAASHIARWDTAKQTWDSLGRGLNGNVYALTVFNGALYAGGNFTMAGGLKVNHIAKWDGAKWDSVGSGFDSGAVYALAVANDTLWAGGSFVTASAMRVNHIARWMGSYWDSIGAGTNNTVYALCYYNFSLIVGGAFTKAGNTTANYISSIDLYSSAIWDNTNTSPGANDTVFALSNCNLEFASSIKKYNLASWGGNGALLVGGSFTIAGGNSSPYISLFYFNWWYYPNWGNINGSVYALANLYPSNGYFNSNYAGGLFDFVTPPASLTVNHVMTFGILSGGGVPGIINNSDMAVVPNPNNGKFTIQMVNCKLLMVNEKAGVEVYNVFGQKVYSQFSTFNSQLSINLSSEPSGVYLYRIESESGDVLGQGKFIIAR